jgi:hypothetical protein
MQTHYFLSTMREKTKVSASYVGEVKSSVLGLARRCTLSNATILSVSDASFPRRYVGARSQYLAEMARVNFRRGSIMRGGTSQGMLLVSSSRSFQGGARTHVVQDQPAQAETQVFYSLEAELNMSPRRDIGKEKLPAKLSIMIWSTENTFGTM